VTPSSKTRPIPYGRHTITEDDILAVVDVLRSDHLTQGPKIAEFEQAFAKYIGSRYAVAVSSGTAALHLCALALGVNSQSRVITSPITFAASANCVRYCGGTIDFVDIDFTTALMDLDLLEKKLKTSPPGTYCGIIPVDFAGYPIDMERIKTIADRYNLWIIEDSCHAPGGWFLDSNGTRQQCGNCRYSDLAIFSFHPVKHIACGEGGMITTNRRDLYEKLLLLRSHGITKNPALFTENHGGWYYQMLDLGYNYRLSDIHAALGLSQLSRANSNLAKRKEIAARYDVAFEKMGVDYIKHDPSRVGHAYHLYVIRHPRRDELYEYLKKHNIRCQVHYIPLHTMPYYRRLGWKPGDLPHAEKYYQHCLSLPIYPALSFEEQNNIVRLIQNFSKL